MATIGQSLLQPESGWRRYDDKDSNISYVGTWTTYNSTSNFGGSLKSSNSIGDIVRFNFTGTKLRIISLTSSGRTTSNNNKVLIDGVEVGSFSLYTPNIIDQCLVFEKTNLANKEHYVEIVKMDSDYFYSDAYDIDSTGIIKPYQVLIMNKTLILSNGEYKKVQNSTRYKDFAVSTTSIIPLMTSDTAPSGKAEASSVYVGEYNYLPYKAFNGGSKISDRWSITGNIGWIKYTFPKEKVVTAYSITTFNAATNYIKASPKDWTFEGSNDGTTWVVLDAQTNQTSWEHGVDKKFGFKNKTPYKSYRVNITMNNGDTYTAIYELKMFGNASDLEYYLEYKAVSSTLPTSNQFIDEGMDSLSPLLDRKVTTLVPQEMAQDTTWTEGGKVFKKSIDLKKYFDIRSINITN